MCILCRFLSKKTLKLCDIGDLHTSFLSKGGVWKSGIFLLIFINLDLITEALEDYCVNTHIVANFTLKYPKIYDLCEYLLHHICISVTKPGVQYIFAKH